MAHADCPNQAELTAFATGHLSGASFARIASHVEQCPACETALQAHDGLTDPLVAQLRLVPGKGGASLEPVPQKLLAAARSARAAGAPAWLTPAGGRRLDKFQLAEEIGAGSFGQ